MSDTAINGMQSQVRPGRVRRALARTAVGVLMGVGVMASVVQLSPGRASADTTYNGNSTGSYGVSCNSVSHAIYLSYWVTPPTYYDTYGGIVPVATVSPLWADVYAYTKPHGSPSSSWKVVAHTTTLVNQALENVLSNVQYGARGNYYDVGFNVRYAVPGGTWSNYAWDAVTSYYESYSGTLYGPGYTFCLT